MKIGQLREKIFHTQLFFIQVTMEHFLAFDQTNIPRYLFVLAREPRLRPI